MSPDPIRHPRLVLAVFTLLLCFGADVLVKTAIHAVRSRPPAAAPGAEAEKGYRIPSPVYHHDLKPLATATATWGPYSYPVSTNSLGFKDATTREVALAPASRRLLFIGDSFTEGVGVEYPKTFVGVIGARLAAHGVEVLNAAVSSYCPAIHFAKVRHLLETVGLRFDELVVYLDVSDADDEANYYRVRDDGTIEDTGRPIGRQRDMGHYLPRNPVLGFLEDHTLLTRAIVFSIRDRKLQLLPRDKLDEQVNLVRGAWSFDAKAFDDYGRVGLERMTAHMDSLAALLERHGVRLTVAVYPWPGQIVLDARDSKIERHWRAWAASHGARFVDHFPDFAEAGTPRAVVERYFIPGDAHVNEAGHAFIAERFVRDFEARAGESARP